MALVGWLKRQFDTGRKVALATSLAINLGLGGTILLYYPLVPFHPVCWRGGPGGLIELEGKMTDRFSRMVIEYLNSWGIFTRRLGDGPEFFVSYMDWRDLDFNRNMTSKAVRDVVQEWPKGTGEKRPDVPYASSKCKHIEKVAVHRP